MIKSKVDESKITDGYGIPFKFSKVIINSNQFNDVDIEKVINDKLIRNNEDFFINATITFEENIDVLCKSLTIGNGKNKIDKMK